METQVINATEYRNVSLSLLNESKTNPRRTFEEIPLKELADSIRTQGVLSPLLVRPITENGFEIIAGARRYRAAQMLVEACILLAASRGNPSTVLKEAAIAYKVDTNAIAAKVRQEFAAKEKARKASQPATKVAKKVA